MAFDPTGFGIGIAFGALLVLSGLADPDKIVGTLRLKDLHALKTIVVFLLVGMTGTWLLEQGNAAHLDVKPTLLLSVSLGGALLGIGFGLTGYCPGTGLACAASGRIDAMVAAAGMLVGAFVYLDTYPWIGARLDRIGDYGKSRLHEATGTPQEVWIFGILAIGIALLFLLEQRRTRKSRA